MSHLPFAVVWLKCRRRVLFATMIFVALLGALPDADARWINWPDDHELLAKSDAVITAKVISVEVTREQGHVQWTDRVTRVVKASLEVKSYVKGAGPKIIEVRYLIIDPKDARGTDDIDQGPMRFELTSGMTCALFLKKSPKNDWYVSVMDEERDNAITMRDLTRSPGKP